MQWARPQDVQGLDVFARAIAFVSRQREPRITTIEIAHERVARRLRENRRRADRRNTGIPFDHRLEQAFEAETVAPWTPIAINEDTLRRDGEPEKRPSHGKHGGLQDVDAVDFLRVR